MPEAQDVYGCQRLLAQVVHDALLVRDSTFFADPWFEEICAMLNWDSDYIRDQIQRGKVPRRRVNLASDGVRNA